MAPNEGFRALNRVESAKDRSVLIAVQPLAFERLIQHLLHGHPGLRVVGGSSKTASAADQAARLAPDVIIASTRLQGKEPGDALADLKRSSPASTLILLIDGLSHSGPHAGADAWLPEDDVVRRLLPVIRKVVGRVRDRAPQVAAADRRA
jgi:DNA-binding NarL/FixJ family response regulator